MIYTSALHLIIHLIIHLLLYIRVVAGYHVVVAGVACGWVAWGTNACAPWRPAHIFCHTSVRSSQSHSHSHSHSHSQVGAAGRSHTLSPLLPISSGRAAGGAPHVRTRASTSGSMTADDHAHATRSSPLVLSGVPSAATGGFGTPPSTTMWSSAPSLWEQVCM